VFSRGADGANPNPGLIQATDGNFYGTTYIGGGSDQGTVFKMTPDGTVTGLHAFTGGSDGAYPFVGLIQGFDGELYGTTYGGGSSNQGTAFKITRDGDVTILHSFFDVGSPSRLLQASDGYFYGTNFGDDIFGGGSIFRMTPAGAVTSLHSFDWIGSTGGSGPDGGLVQGADGAFYGTTVWGGIAGQTGHGTLFRLRFSSTAAAPVTESVPSPKDSPIAIGSNSLRGEARNLYATMAYGRRWTLRTTRQPAHTASQPSAHRGAWEIEAFAGTTFTSQPTGGTATLPPGGVPFVTTTGSPSRSVSSWYLGDGAALLNGVNTALAVSQQITPLDAALNTSLVERPSGGGGVRVSRIFTPRLTAEFTVEFSAVRGDLSNQASTSIEASRVSFLSAWQGLASAGQFSDTTMSSVRTGQLDNGHQIVATGAINVALKTAGKVIPYITVGAGVSSNSGTAASAGLVGDYRFSLGGVTPFHETDSVTVRYTAPDQTAVGVLGAGVKYQMSPHVGLRFDYRTYLGPNRDTTVLDGHPVVSTLTPAGSGASATTPGIQFSNDASIGIQSSLSGPKITDFRTFAGSGMQRHARLTFGLFWRF
jgi:uncharacterized repeat protein (TIGR03803 family)